MMRTSLPTFEKIIEQFRRQHYIADRQIAVAVFLSMRLQKPLLIEGPPGVGKTEIAKVLAQVLNTELIRLQCYEGLDANAALYEWNYQHQLLHIKLTEQSDQTIEEKESTIFSEKFLLKRPLLRAITQPKPPVLLIDEIDRADEEFESFLLEVLSDWQISIPEIGTIRATSIPYAIITSNRFRELSDALRRRCLYLWIDYPSYEKELAIVREKVPELDENLAEQICQFVQQVRRRQLQKRPGIAETLDWARALVSLHKDHLTPDTLAMAIGVLFKDREDIEVMKTSFMEFLERLNVRFRLAEMRQEQPSAPSDEFSEKV